MCGAEEFLAVGVSSACSLVYISVSGVFGLCAFSFHCAYWRFVLRVGSAAGLCISSSYCVNYSRQECVCAILVDSYSAQRSGENIGSTLASSHPLPTPFWLKDCPILTDSESDEDSLRTCYRSRSCPGSVATSCSRNPTAHCAPTCTGRNGMVHLLLCSSLLIHPGAAHAFQHVALSSAWLIETLLHPSVGKDACTPSRKIKRAGAIVAPCGLLRLVRECLHRPGHLNLETARGKHDDLWFSWLAIIAVLCAPQ